MHVKRVYITFPKMLDANTCIPSNIIKNILTIDFIKGNPNVLHLPSLPANS